MNNGANKLRRPLPVTMTLMVFLAVALSACTNGQVMPGAVTPEDVAIKIFFKPDSDNDMCAYKVDLDNPLTFKGKKITWQAVDKNGNNDNSIRFQIFFDPVQGGSLKATGSISRPIDNNAPSAKYKYTVWDWPQGNNDNACDPLDPHFRVN